MFGLHASLQLIGLSLIASSAAIPAKEPLYRLEVRNNNTNTTNVSDNSNNSCRYLKQNLTSDCWDELDISGYLNQWWKDNEADCSFAGADFASCFQQKAGVEQEQCDMTGRA